MEKDEVLRCVATGHPCGTDTWAVGWECQCVPCQKYLEKLTGLTAEQRKINAIRNLYRGR